MCCVVGFVGSDVSRSRVITGLSRLEYRGYDSAGFACINAKDHLITAVKVVGGVEQLSSQAESLQLDGAIGIGHTRWATHGVVTTENAHPVFDCSHTCAVVHNGIIDHEQKLRNRLLTRGHSFRSQTDSELIAHLFEEQVQSAPSSPGDMIHAVIKQLEGAYAFVVMLHAFPDILFAARRRSPLCIGRGRDGFFIVSDPSACAGSVTSIAFLPDESYAIIYRDHYDVFSYNGDRLILNEMPLELVWEGEGKRGYEHYMLKEIYEQRDVIRSIGAKLPTEIDLFLSSSVGSELDNSHELLFTACGTSLHAAHIAASYFEAICHLRTSVYCASDVRDRSFLHTKDVFGLALSQSGETADTLEAMRILKQKNVKVLALVNRELSTMTREADHFLLLHAGLEVAVASTKTLVAHLGIAYLLAHDLAVKRGISLPEQAQTARLHLISAADDLHTGLTRSIDTVDLVIAPRLARYKQCIFIGRSTGYTVAQEGALKLKELAYLFAEAHRSGELKHGPLALVEEGLPVIVCSTLEPIAYHKLIANVQEVRARKGWIVALLFEGQEELQAAADVVCVLPQPSDPLLAPIVMMGALQYLAYRIAAHLKLPIDKPRNLAKSVTVE